MKATDEEVEHLSNMEFFEFIGSSSPQKALPAAINTLEDLE